MGARQESGKPEGVKVQIEMYWQVYEALVTVPVGFLLMFPLLCWLIICLSAQVPW